MPTKFIFVNIFMARIIELPLGYLIKQMQG